MDRKSSQILRKNHNFLNAIEWRAAIEPKSLFDIEGDIPKLNELDERVGYLVDAPVGFRATYSSWDMTRDMKNYMLIDGNVQINHMDWVSDDNGDNDEDGNPYDGAGIHPSGEIFSTDSPGLIPSKRFLNGILEFETPGVTMVNNHVFQE